uniref:Alkyl transferase n=1 Tax=Setaria digitata TaxID=48799 RepID=A0A915PNP2_9BILA
MWFNPEEKKAWWHGLLKYFLTLGPIPEHIAFIMDGNRRYARRQRYLSFVEGHRKGFEQLTKVMQWCREFGVKEVTVYVFSLENFKRSATEVADLLTLLEQKLLQLLDESLFFGNLRRLPLKLRQYIARIELLTREHNRLKVEGNFIYLYACFKKLSSVLSMDVLEFSGSVNVCVAYTAQDELRRAFVTIAHGVQKGLLTTTDINEYLISRCLDSRFSNDPDLLIRTSGEARLSDFLLWQCSKCHIYFNEVLWPDFDYWNLCKAIYFYQQRQTPLKQLNEKYLTEKISTNSENVSEFLRWADEERLEDLRQMSEAIC